MSNSLSGFHVSDTDLWEDERLLDAVGDALSAFWQTIDRHYRNAAPDPEVDLEWDRDSDLIDAALGAVAKWIADQPTAAAPPATARCQCGAAVARTPHSEWCPLY